MAAKTYDVPLTAKQIESLTLDIRMKLRNTEAFAAKRKQSPRDAATTRALIIEHTELLAALRKGRKRPSASEVEN